MNLYERFMNIGEECAAQFYKDMDRSLFYRKCVVMKKYFETLPLSEYTGKSLYPSGGRPEHSFVKLTYMEGIAFDRKSMGEKDKELLEFYDKHPINVFRSSIPPEHTVGGDMFTHSMPNYERICREGFSSYRPRIEKIKDRDIREGLLLLLSGIECYIERCVDYLSSVDADKELIDALRNVPMNPCRSFYEAVVCWNFVLYLDCCDNLGCVANGLLPYYKGEDAAELLDNLFDNLDVNGGYSMSLGTDTYNPLVLMCIKALKGKRRPMAELFIDEDTPMEVWEAALEVVKNGGGQPAFYNKKVLLGGLLKRFPEITEEDIKKFCGGGCTESMIAGHSNVGSLDAGLNLALIMENCVQEHLTKCGTYEEFYQKFISEVSRITDIVTCEVANNQKARSELNPLPMRTLLIDDCIDNGLDYNNGGAKYMWSIISYAGLINAIDSLAVIKDFVFERKEYTAEQLTALLKANDEVFLSKARSHKNAYGNGNDDTNREAFRVSRDIFSMLEGKKTHFGLGFLPAAIQFNTAARAGENVGATPDGRPSGSPLCESLGAINGKDTKGPTVMLESVTSLDLERALGVPVVNLTVNPDFDNNVLKGLVMGYIQNGGIQLQISCTDRKALLEAFRNPEMHRNLIVRVGGYSEYFHRLPRNLQESIIQRSIHL